MLTQEEVEECYKKFNEWITYLKKDECKASKNILLQYFQLMSQFIVENFQSMVYPVNI